MTVDQPEALITAIMPLKYYHLDFLRRSLQSILAQSCPDWRLVIVVEPGDVEHFENLLKNELVDARVDLIMMQGRPFTGSINTGMRYAKTEFVALLFADDMWSKDAVETLQGYITRSPQVDFFHSSRVMIDENDLPISSVRYSRENLALEDFKRRSPIKHLLCWRREKGLAVGGIDETLSKAPDDYDFPWTMAEHGAVFMAVKECLYLMRNHCHCYRRTTHIPVSEIKRGLRKIMRKHGVGRLESWRLVKHRIRRGNIGQQAIYRNRLDRWLAEHLSWDARKRWQQQTYR